MKRFFLLTVFHLVVVASSDAFSQDYSRERSHWPVNATLVTPNPNEGARRLYQFLYDTYGSKIISGVMTLNSFDETQWLKTNTGKEPALVGLDFMHSGRGYTWYNDKQPIEDARIYYNKNGIPALCWHWRDPSRQTEEFYTANTSFDVSKIFDPLSTEYQAMIADIDYISEMLKELRDENVPVIWRPLHEAKGGWFWWGAKGGEACKELYQVMFDRMVNYHGLNNLIWVWTREPNDESWYPGDEIVDIVGRDLYVEGDHSSHVTEWTEMNNLYSKTKIITMSECGSFPDPDNLVNDGAAWSWFMPWYGAFVRDSKYNFLSLWKKTLAHEYVLTLDEMPDLKTYEATLHPVAAENWADPFALHIFPTEVDDSVNIVSTTTIGTVFLMHITGQVVAKYIVPKYREQIFIPPVKQGIYYLKVGSHAPVKIIKK
jgi:mannan endo-1,4-beta-mannosidase